MIKKPTPINQTTLRILYFQYKSFIVPGVVITACILLTFFVILPELAQWFNVQDQVASSQAQLQALNKNIATLSQVNQATLDKDFQAVSSTLPPNKDFASIVNAVSNAAITAGVSLGDYTFEVGPIATDLLTVKDANLQLSLVILGGLSDVKRFLEALKNESPLSDVNSVSVSAVSSSVELTFFITPFPKLAFQSQQVLTVLTPHDESLIQSFPK